MRATVAEHQYRRLGIPMAAGEVIPLYQTTADPRPFFEALRIGCLHVRQDTSIYSDMRNRKIFLELGWHNAHIVYLVVPYEFCGGWGRISENLHYWRIYSTISFGKEDNE